MTETALIAVAQVYAYAFFLGISAALMFILFLGIFMRRTSGVFG